MSHFEFPETSASKSIAPVQSRCSPILTPLAYWLGQKLVLPFYFEDVQILGQEIVPRSGPVILAPTHRARWDSIVLPLAAGRPATGRDLRFMVTADEVRGFQGWLIRRLGGFPVNVKRPTISSLRHGIDLLRQESMLVIYPEGGIFRDQQVHRLKPGLGRLAVQAQAMKPDVPIRVIPVSLHYDSPFPQRGSSVQVRFGSALMVTDYSTITATPEALKHGAAQLTADLQTALTDLVAGTPDCKLALAAH